MVPRLSQFAKLSGLGRTQYRNFANAAKNDASNAYHHELQHTREHAKTKEHEEHMAHHPYEYKPWPHLRIRKKSFPWGDGDHTLFHNSAINMDPPQE